MNEKIEITDGITVIIDLSTFNESIIENYNEDQLFDTLLYAIQKRKMLKSTAFERICVDFKDEIEELIEKSQYCMPDNVNTKEEYEQYLKDIGFEKTNIG